MGDWMRRMRHLYPENWPELARQVKEAAGWRCTACDAPHGPPPHILTVDHLDHDPGNNDLANLAALCQSCHLKRQSLRPRPSTKDEAIQRLRTWRAEQRAQQAMQL